MVDPPLSSMSLPRVPRPPPAGRHAAGEEARHHRPGQGAGRGDRSLLYAALPPRRCHRAARAVLREPPFVKHARLACLPPWSPCTTCALAGPRRQVHAALAGGFGARHRQRHRQRLGPGRPLECAACTLSCRCLAFPPSSPCSHAGRCPCRCLTVHSPPPSLASPCTAQAPTSCRTGRTVVFSGERACCRGLAFQKPAA